MSRIKVAFVIDVGWIGGINYFRNLLFAIEQVKERTIEPVIIVGKRSDTKLLNGLPNFQIIRTSILDESSFWWEKNRKYGNRLFKWLLNINGIKVLSHTPHTRLGNIKTIGWIPDFQHRHFPELFSKEQIIGRNNWFMEMAKNSTRILLSSEDACKDFNHFAPDYSYKVRVLNFVSIPSIQNAPDLATLQKKYSFNRPYFYIPNQFWVHKNHKVVVDALIKLKSSRPDVLVISTGFTQDYRNPEYFSELERRIEEGAVSGNFKILGVVPYEDVVGLLVNAQAMINPSLFEGWSTSVEESKSLGVPMLLSDIAVHIEQAKNTAIFFSVNEPASLAEKMLEIIDNGNRSKVAHKTTDRAVNNQKRLEEFGDIYQKIVMEMMQ
jgi:glycosyltransferase involved in cell wall biosynthesis